MAVRLHPGKRAARRDRSALLLAAVAFVALQLGTGLWLDDAPLRVRHWVADAALDRATATDPSPEWLFFGSSRFMAAIDTGTLKETIHVPTVSIVAEGSGIVGSAMLLERALDRGAAPRAVFIEMSPEWFVRPPRYLDAQMVRMFDWSDVWHWLPELALQDLDKTIWARLLPSYRYRHELLTAWVGEEPPYVSATLVAASGGSAGTPPVDPAIARLDRGADFEAKPEDGARRWGKRVSPFPISERTVGALERALDRCRDAGIRCVLITPPLSSFQRAEYGDDVQNAYEALFEELEREFDAPHLDFSASAPDEDFLDSSHITNDAGERFSARIGPRLLRAVTGEGPTR